MDPQFLAQIRQRRALVLDQVRRLPIAAVVWGPAPTSASPLAAARVALRDALRRQGHVAHFSEELYDPTQPFSIHTQQAADVESHDIVFSLPGSPGSIAEAHDFYKLPGLSRKLITFLDNGWSDGYASKSLIELRSLATGDIILYDAPELPDCIVTQALAIVGRLQEVQFIMGRRV